MDIRLIWERLYWALVKRFLKKKQKTYGDWKAKGYINDPTVSFIIQSHNKSVQVKHVVNKLRNYPRAEIVVIDDGLDYNHHISLMRFLNRGNEFLLRANDLYENVMYDKTIRMVNGRFVALLQDDDDFKDLSWVDDAVFYFEKYPELAILGGRDCLDFAIDKQKGRFDILDYDLPTKDIDFCFVPHVNRAPMWLNRSLFLEKLKHIDFDFAPFQFDDVELCLRTWLNGCQVGWYKTGFSSLSAGGMRIWNNAFTQEQCEKNICKLYDLYSDKDVELHRIINTSNNNLGCHG